jgi:hypothetical protein
MNENYADFEPTDVPLFNWGGIDHEAIRQGFDYFFSQNQVTGFKMDKNGEYERTEDGRLVAYRTSTARSLPKCWFNNYHQ